MSINELNDGAETTVFMYNHISQTKPKEAEHTRTKVKFFSNLNWLYAIALALVIFAGCSSDVDVNNIGVGKGQIEYQGKTYSFDGNSAVITGNAAPFNVMLSFASSTSATASLVCLTSSSKTELLNIKAVENIVNNFSVSYDYTNSSSGFLNNCQVQINKSGNNYDIVITAVANPIIGPGAGTTYPIRITWKGPIVIVNM